MQKSFTIVATVVLALPAATIAQNNTTMNAIQYPQTRKDLSVTDQYFGTTVADPYRWLEDDRSAETNTWFSAQNKVTRQYLEQIPFRGAIKSRLEQLWNFERFSAPFKAGAYTYYSRNSGLQNQAVVYRQKNNSTPELFLDPNTFSEKGTVSLAGMNFSKDGSLVAYQLSDGGSDWHTIVVMNAETKEQIGETLKDVKFSNVAWKGNDGFYYSSYQKPYNGSQLSAKTQEHQLFYHQLGTPQSSDVLIFGGSKQPRRYISADVTENEEWLIISAANTTYGNELYVQNLTVSGASIVPIVNNMLNSHQILLADDAFFYIETDKDAPNNKIVKAPLQTPLPDNWVEVVAETKQVMNATTGGGFLFCSYLKDAVSQIVQYDFKGKRVREIALPGIGTASGFSGKEKDAELYFNFTSYTYPSSVFKLVVATGQTTLFKQPKVLFNPADYESKQVFYKSKDGTQIPMILTYKKGLVRNGKNPTVLYGYGGFNISLTPAFSVANIVLLENGGIYAVANLRGGGEYGKAWHDAGVKTHKQNVFDDFIAAAEYLQQNKYTSPAHLAISGGSNGGLLVGAVMTQKPALCKVALPAVGVLDMLRYHKFTAGAGWAYDYGTSEESKEMFAYLKNYSPLHNIKKGVSYPATMVTTADHDDRVVPAHSFKFAATLQEMHQGKNPVLIRIETQAGHGAGMSTQQLINGVSDKWAFVFYNMGIVPKAL